MMNIRPVSDLFDKFPEVEDTVLRRGEPVFLTKDGYGYMVLMGLVRYELMVCTTAEEREFLRKRIEELMDLGELEDHPIT